jgi:hypothetical protein
MSYDIWVTEYGEEVYLTQGNSPTYNLGKMIRRADELAGGKGCSFAAIDHRDGIQAEIWFRRILDALVKHEDVIRPLEPSNGWGTYDQLVDCFRYYQSVAKERPHSFWRQSGDGETYNRCCGGWVCGTDARADTELRRVCEQEKEDGQERAEEGAAQDRP